MLLDDLTNREIAILQATKASENALTAEELAQNAEAPLESAKQTLGLLTERNILKCVDWPDVPVYCFPDNDDAQQVYDELHGAE